MPRICRENDLGPIEYKRELKNMIESKIKKYATQMKFRLIESSINSTDINMIIMFFLFKIIPEIPVRKSIEATVK